jgi:hypothetical protein
MQLRARSVRNWVDNQPTHSYMHTRSMHTSTCMSIACSLLLQVGKDARVVLQVVYEAIRTGAEPQYLSSNPKEDFYLALYRGLYLEAQGDTERSAQEIEKAVKSRCAQLPCTCGHFIHFVLFFPAGISGAEHNGVAFVSLEQVFRH